MGNRCSAFTRLSYAMECLKRSRNIGCATVSAMPRELICWVHSGQMKIKLFSFIKKPRDSCRMALPLIRMDANVQPSNEGDFSTRQKPSPHSQTISRQNIKHQKRMTCAHQLNFFSLRTKYWLHCGASAHTLLFSPLYSQLIFADY